MGEALCKLATATLPRPSGNAAPSGMVPAPHCVTFTILPSQQRPCACEFFGSFVGDSVKYSVLPRLVLVVTFFLSSSWATPYSTTSRTVGTTCCEAAGYWFLRTETSVHGSKSSLLVCLCRSSNLPRGLQEEPSRTSLPDYDPKVPSHPVPHRHSS